MSGILGVLNLDGRPLDPQLPSMLTKAMEFRGPDGSTTWTDGPMGFGHAALRTSHGEEGDRQLCSLDQNSWICADLRLDGRDELVGELRARGHEDARSCSDAELVLHAHAVWGGAAMDHLLGDFAFAIWNRREQALFCGRDPFGVKPFYYARLGETLLISNTLDALRAHPDFTGDLDETAIADFLLFSFNGHPERTAFTDVRKLPPACTLEWAPGGKVETKRYWDLAVTELTRYRQGSDYVDHFLELFGHAVADRTRCDSVSVLMSGGMDSTSVAWMAAQSVPHLKAFTFGYDRLILDDEHRFASEVGAALGIDVHFVGLDEHGPEYFWDPDSATGRFTSPDPVDLPATGRISGLLRPMSEGTRVGLSGQGGDPLLHLSRHDFAFHFRKRRVGVSLEVAKYWRSHGRLPRVGMRTSIKRRLQGVRGDELPVYPPWLQPDLEARLGLTERWKQELEKLVGSGTRRDATGENLAETIRPWAQDDLTAPVWPVVFEGYDPGVTRFMAEVRHPFFDLRLVEFLLSVPPLPWLVDKELLRVAMRDKLPDAVRRRPKAPLDGYPVHEGLVRCPPPDLKRIAEASGIERFVDLERFLVIARQPQKLRPSEYALITRPLGLAVWLQKAAS